MKLKKLILHIGVHKTGTTAIQTFLYENRDLLNRQGFYMPVFLYCQENKPADLRYSIIDGKSNETRIYLEEIVKNAKENSCHTVIISDEDYCKTNEDDLRNVKIFDEFFDEIEVLIYARRPDRQSESGYAFCVMWHGSKYSKSPDIWYGNNPGKDYYKHASFYKNNIKGCNIKVVSYDFKAENLIDSFIEACGMESIEYKQPKKDESNISANKYMIEIMNEINKYDLKDKLFFEIKNHVLNHKKLQNGPKAIFFSNELRMANQKGIETSTKKFIEEFNKGEEIFKELEPIEVPEGLEKSLKKSIVDEIVRKYNLSDKKQPESIIHFKEMLNIHESIDSADIYREIGIVCFELKFYEAAYRFMKLAHINRREGPTIREKLMEIKEKLHTIDEDDEEESRIRRECLIARYVKQTDSIKNRIEKIINTIRRQLKPAKGREDFEILWEIALFCEWYDEIKSAYAFMLLAKSKKNNGGLINDKCIEYKKILNENTKKDRPKVYLHVGANKTASTSIQTTLTSNREMLKNYGQGFFYPKAWGANKTKSFKYLCLEDSNRIKLHIKDILGEKDVEYYNREILEEMIEELKGYEGRNYIFSGEDLYYMTYANLNSTRDLLELLIPDCEIQVVFVIRNFVSFMNSVVQQAAKGGNIEKHFIKRLYKKDEFFKKAIKNLRNVFGEENLTLYTFEESVKDELGPVGFFMEKIGLDDAGIKELDIQRKNESLSNSATKFVFFMNEMLPKSKYLEFHRKYKIRGLCKKFQSVSGSGKYAVDKKTVKKFYPMMKKEAEWLKQEYDIDYTDYEKKDEDIKVVFDHVFMEEVKDIFLNTGYIKKQLMYKCFLNKSRSWRLDKKSRATFAALVKWCKENHKRLTEIKFDTNMRK